MRKYLNIGVLLSVLWLSACQQRVWQPEVQLSESDLPVNKTITVNAVAETTIAPYREQVTAKMSEVIGTAPAELQKDDYQSPLGNFVVDLQREQSQPLYGAPIDLSLTTNGGLRVPVPQGKVNVGTIFELMPFENELVVLTLDGNMVKELFDFAASTKIAPIANATYTVKNGKATDILIGGQPLNLQRNYTLVTSDYLAGGGDNMSLLKKALKTEKVGLMMRDAILQHIRQLTAQGKLITADTTTRVTVIP
ncbi:5'-nucleotidase C-terminal domain-containing protein [Pontibacter sp. SGAir0037]|uniref:5'-nucleotidase C-terminal domain-containing protein n=1 Tax=Pontibacter sp. SGAir0037 TaxID=2571030 RepID=UPI0010CD15EA|nr:5'-nucleotidase [Pontibacter sp. SGAir0037]QCR24791.1 hypothetical protein C1N53_22160 [Pontibacter sp. SGAir0037]